MSEDQTSPVTLSSTPRLGFNMGFRLSLMMFLQYGIWGAWLPILYPYLMGHVKFTEGQVGVIFSAGAIGAIIGPFFAGQNLSVAPHSGEPTGTGSSGADEGEDVRLLNLFLGQDPAAERIDGIETRHPPQPGDGVSERLQRELAEKSVLDELVAEGRPA